MSTCDVCHRTFETEEQMRQHRAFRDERGGHGHPYPSIEEEHVAWERAIDTARREWNELMVFYDDHREDNQAEHVERDRLLLRLVAVLDPGLAGVMRERQEQVDYWYA